MHPRFACKEPECDPVRVFLATRCACALRVQIVRALQISYQRRKGWPATGVLQALAEKTLSAYEIWRKTLASFVRENYAALGVHFFSHWSFWRTPLRRVAA